MTTKPKTRKAAPKEFKLDLPGQTLLDAAGVLGDATSLTDAVTLIALEVGEYECGAICAVADAIKAKISDGLALIDAYSKETGLPARRVEAARKAAGLA